MSSIIGLSMSALAGRYFLEYVPQTLAAWLGGVRDGGSPYPWVEDALARGTSFMSSRGLVHFDAHFANLLTDGRQVYFADLGLALSRDFELSAEEAVFLADHLVYDRCYAPAHLLRHHLPDDLRGGMGHEAFLREWIAGRRPGGVPPEIGAVIDRHARSALVLGDFHHRLLTESKRTPFPAADVQRALAAAPDAAESAAPGADGGHSTGRPGAG